MDTATTVTVIDGARMLALIEETVAACPGERRDPSLVTQCLERAGLDPGEARSYGHRDIRSLYAQRRLPVRLTLSATVALHVAERSRRIGLDDRTVLANARRVEQRVARSTPWTVPESSPA